MSLVHVIVPTLAVFLSWICIGVVIASCGYPVRRLLVGRLMLEPVRAPVVADLWIGLATLVGYLQFWSLFFAVSWIAWVAPTAVAIGVLAAIGRRIVSTFVFVQQLSIKVLALIAVGTLWVANRALGPASDYDLGLYHLGSIDYALKYSAIPGLANLHVRLGAGDAHLLVAAFLDHGPWAGLGLHLVNGLLVAGLFLETGARFAIPSRSSAGPSFSNRMALLLVPATVAAVGILPDARLSSPDLDFAAFVAAGVGTLYLASTAEHGFEPISALTSLSMLAVASVTRPLYWFLTILAVVAIVSTGVRTHALDRRQIVRLMARAAVLPTALLGGLAARQAVLSGYPFFPTTLGGLPVSWRVPTATIDAHARSVSAWARWPGMNPDEVLRSWRWVRAAWLPRLLRDLDVIAPALLVAAVLPSILRRSPRGNGRGSGNLPMLAVLLPSLATLLPWFLLAPDPRFALAPIWLSTIAIAAWALPAGTREFSKPLIACTLLVTALLVAWGNLHLALMPPIALASWTAIMIGDHWRSLGSPAALAHSACLSAVIASIGTVALRGAFTPVVADHHGTFGTAREPRPPVLPFRTSSGLELLHPAYGDQCWGTLRCTPYPDLAVRLRGATFADGLTRSHRHSAVSSWGRRAATAAATGRAGAS